MSFPDLKVHTTGKLICNRFSFSKAGDELPAHEHDETTNHITIILSGRFKVFGNGWEHEYGAGDFLDWKVGQVHGFIALTDGAVLLNILKG